MLIGNTLFDGVELATLLASDAPLSDGQKVQLAAEVGNDPTGRGYAGKTPAEALVLLATPYTGDNPDPQGRVPRASMTPDEFSALVATVAGRLAANGQELRDKWDYYITRVVPNMVRMVAVDLGNAEVLGGIQMLETDGLLSADEVAAATTIPDPYWQATVNHQPRQRELFGAGVSLTLADLAAAGVS